MANYSISLLPTEATAQSTDLIETAIVDANSASGYASRKETLAAVGEAVVSDFQFPLLLTETTDKTIVGAINEVAGEVANLKVHTNNKRKIGTWTDGRDIYEKVIEIINSTATFTDFIDVEEIPNIDFPIKIEWGATRYTNNKYYYYTGNGASVTESGSTYYILTRIMGQTLQYRIGGYGTQIGKMFFMITYVET